MDFSKFDFKNLTDGQLEHLYVLADDTIKRYDVVWEEQDGSVHYAKLISEGDEFDYFTGIRVEAKRTLVAGVNYVKQIFSQMLNISPSNMLIREVKTTILLHLNVRGTPENEIVVVKV